MASIKVNVSGWEAELDIPDDNDVTNYLRRECMMRACILVQQQLAFYGGDSDTGKMNVLGALMTAIKAHFPSLPSVKLTEE